MLLFVNSHALIFGSLAKLPLTDRYSHISCLPLLIYVLFRFPD